MSLLRRITPLKCYFNSITRISDFYIQRKSYPQCTKCATPYRNYCRGQGALNGISILLKENTFSHHVLENIPGYSMTVSDPAISVENISVRERNYKNLDPLKIPLHELLSLFETVCHDQQLDFNDAFKVFDAVEDRCHEMDDDQLSSVLGTLRHSSIFKCYKKTELASFWRKFDNVCIKRWKTWPLPKVFYFIDLFYFLGLTKNSEFIFASAIKFVSKPNSLSPQQVVQLLFYMNVLRHSINVPLYNLECKLESCIEDLSIEEIGVALMGFFKTQNALHSDKIINHVIDKTINEIKSVPEITLACILKALRFSMTVPFWDRIPELLNAVEQELPRLTIKCSVHASLLTTRPQIIHEGTLRKVSQKLVDCITTCRLKDMEKAVFPLAQENFDPETKPCIYESILNELNNVERKDEMDNFPKALIALVHYLCLKGIYAENLIQKVLDMEFLYHAYGKRKYMFGREVLYIDTTMELECPTYKGTRLPVDIRNYLSKKYSESIADPNKIKMSKHKLWHLEIKRTAETTFGKDNIIEKYLLPNHPRADIVVNLNNNNEPQPPDIGFKNIEAFTGPIRAPKNGNYVALVVASKNMFLYQTTIPNGETVSKLKQLRLLGYKPILVDNEDWPYQNTLEKIMNLKTLIQKTS